MIPVQNELQEWKKQESGRFLQDRNLEDSCRNSNLDYTPPPFEWTQNKNNPFMEFHCREQYSWKGEVIVVLVIGVFHIAIIVNDNLAPPSSLTASETSTNDEAAIAVAVDIETRTHADTDVDTDANATNTETDEINLRMLDKFRNRELVEKLVKAQKMLSN
jgi:hypothetical protein